MTAITGQERFTPSPIFVGLVAATVVFGALLWRGESLGGLAVFLFVVTGWVVSLALHEFAHAMVAFVGGDRSVADKGYLTLDIRNYVEPGLSIVMPIIFLLIGGIGLPGGAVWINRGAIRSKAMESAMSAAGPAANAVCAAICLLPIQLGLLDGAATEFRIGLGFLGALQVIAVVLNLVPIPGFDGFGIIEPHLSRETLQQLQPLRQYGFLVFFAALFLVPAVGDRFWDITDWVSRLLGGDTIEFLRFAGWNEFRFWER